MFQPPECEKLFDAEGRVKSLGWPCNHLEDVPADRREEWADLKKKYDAFADRTYRTKRSAFLTKKTAADKEKLNNEIYALVEKMHPFIVGAYKILHEANVKILQGAAANLRREKEALQESHENGVANREEMRICHAQMGKLLDKADAEDRKAAQALKRQDASFLASLSTMFGFFLILWKTLRTVG